MVKEAFDLLDHESVGSISASQAVFIARALGNAKNSYSLLFLVLCPNSLGFAPTNAQAEKLEKSLGGPQVDYSKLKTFYKDIPSDVKQPSQMEQVSLSL